MENNYFKNSKDVLGTFYTSEAGTWQVAGNIFDNITWSAKGTRQQPGRTERDVDDVGQHPVLLHAGRRELRAHRRQPDGRRQHGPEGLRRLVHPDDADRHADVDHHPDADPTTTPTSTPTPTPTSTTPSGTNLSLSAGADGSSKGSGTSYGNVKDGSLSTYWSPSGSTGSISIKWGSATKVSKVNIRETSGASGRIGAWKLINADTGAVLKTGTGAGVISFTSTSLKKITFEITSASSTPQVAEFETYAS